MRELVIDGRRIADDEPCYVIAEIGNNHSGDIQTALHLIDAASDAGADAVKFQRRSNRTLYARALLEKPYDGSHSFGATYGEHREALELAANAYPTLFMRAHQKGVTLFATAFDEQSVDDLEQWLEPPAYKIHSGGLTDTALLRYVASMGRPVILSTGGATIEQVDDAVATLLGHTTRIAVLHATAAYPAAFEELNLRCIQTLRERYPFAVVGWSCHVHNLSMVMAAYALGARIIETHFTLNRSMKGTDHAFSMEPATLKKLCKDLKRGHLALGDGVKRLYPSEIGPLSKMRREMTPQGLHITGSTAWATSVSSASSRTS